MVATVRQHGLHDSDPEMFGAGSSAELPYERRRKAGQSEHADREGTGFGKGLKPFQNVGDVKNDSAGL